MFLDHPLVKNYQITDIVHKNGKRMRTLVIETDIPLPTIGSPCRDRRLNDLLEYLGWMKGRQGFWLERVESIEIRGAAANDFPHAQTHRPAPRAAPDFCPVPAGILQTHAATQGGFAQIS